MIDFEAVANPSSLHSMLDFPSNTDFEMALQRDGAKLELFLTALCSGRERYSILLLTLLLAKLLNDNIETGYSAEQAGHNLLNDAFTTWAHMKPIAGGRA